MVIIGRVFMVDVGVNGYGTIGKRVAEAVMKQPDMKLVGVTKVHADYDAEIAKGKRIPIYTAGDVKNFEGSGIEISGSLEQLLEKCDVMVDCTPEGSGEKNKALYEKAGVKAIWQGGEEHELTGLSFNAYSNYNDAIGAKFVRVVSCNTTGLLRTLFPLKIDFGIKEAEAVMIRRAADPSETKKGPINAIEPEKEMPSHHGHDVQTVVPEINLTTTALKVPSTLMHVHSVSVLLEKKASQEQILATLRKNSRVIFVSSKKGITDTAQIMEYAKGFGRSMNDLYEVAVWDSVNADGEKVIYNQAVHQEAIVIPENIDAIRAMFELQDAKTSMAMTDQSLGIPLRSEP